jgi:hypothetical protein
MIVKGAGKPSGERAEIGRDVLIGVHFRSFLPLTENEVLLVP